MLLSNITLFHPVHAAGTYGYITLVIFQRKRTFVLKKNVKNISWEKYVQARAFWRNGSYAPDCDDLKMKSVFNFLSWVYKIKDLDYKTHGENKTCQINVHVLLPNN